MWLIRTMDADKGRSDVYTQKHISRKGCVVPEVYDPWPRKKLMNESAAPRSGYSPGGVFRGASLGNVSLEVCRGEVHEYIPVQKYLKLYVSDQCTLCM